MKLNEITDSKLNEQIASLILAYYEENHALSYDSSRQEFSVLGLQSRPEYLMVRDALISLGASGCDNWKGKLVVREDQGGKEIAINIKEQGLRFAGEKDLKSKTRSIS